MTNYSKNIAQVGTKPEHKIKIITNNMVLERKIIYSRIRTCEYVLASFIGKNCDDTVTYFHLENIDYSLQLNKCGKIQIK